ncbi:MAG: hypothetical protein K6G46_02725, partial [Prevotella sp.]|nr:hypothetical protein [Prevotella sp.]
RTVFERIITDIGHRVSLTRMGDRLGDNQRCQSGSTAPCRYGRRAGCDVGHAVDIKTLLRHTSPYGGQK